ncbi:ABC transporter permease [Ilumatobacter sp.]|uniref:ABC transporter permease n=1 Tax=Ilumatobacter sp. TaxID=1967498 RepID=UPI003C51CCFD
MNLALKELRRRPGRFATATVIITLIAILLMFLGSLLDGLIESSTGAIRAQDADALVYSASAQASFPRSRIEPDIRAAVESVDGVDEVGGIGLVQLGARVPDNGPRDLANVAMFGYELAPDGVPAPPADGQAYADDVLKADGIEEGMTILVGPARTPVEIVGFVSDTSFNGQGGLWANESTWRTTLADNRPDAQLADGVWQSLVVRGDADPDAIDAATDGATDSYTIDGAVAAIPGVEEQQGTFNQIIGVTIAVALVVIGLFFALITVERVSLYGVLKALGAKSMTIFGGLMVQAVVVTLIASAIAAALVVLLDLVIPPGSIPIAVSAGSILSSTALLLLAAAVGCSFSLRRVLKVDPASAIGTTS